MASPSVTYTFSNGATADADQVNQNFTDLINSLTDSTKALSIEALTCAGNVAFNANTTIGNATADDLTVTARLASDLIPKTTGTYDLGSSSLLYAELHAQTCNLDGTVTINTSEADKDFRVGANSITNALFVQGSDGFVGIGTGTPGARLNVSGGLLVDGTDFIYERRATTPSGAGTTFGVFGAQAISTGTTYVTGAQITAISDGAWSGTSAPTRLDFRTCASGSTTSSIGMTLDSSGNLGIGGSPAANVNLDVINTSSNARIQIHCNDGASGRAWNLISRTDGSLGIYDADATAYRMYIDSSGNITLSANAYVNNGFYTHLWRSVSTDTDSPLIVSRSSTENGSETYISFFENVPDVESLGSGSQGGGIRRNSGDSAYEFFNSSDERLKNVKGEYSGGLVIVNNVPVKIWDWKREDKANDCVGWIAQDVQKFIPKAVGEYQENGETYLNLGTSELLPIMWNAIQELAAKVEALESK